MALTKTEVRSEAYRQAASILRSHWDGSELRHDFDEADDDAIREYLKARIIPEIERKSMLP